MSVNLFAIHATFPTVTGQVNFDQMRQEDSQQYDIPELGEFSSKKGLNILHQNIRGLLTNKHNICQILNGLKNLHIFSLSETRLSADNEVEAQIEGYTFIESLGVQVKVVALDFISPRLCPSTDERIWKMRS